MKQTSIKGPIQITIDGPQGSGKTQVAQMIREALESSGIGEEVSIGERQVIPASIVLGYDPELAGPGFTVNGVASFDLASAIALACDWLRRQGAPVPDDLNLRVILAAPQMLGALEILLGDVERAPKKFTREEKMALGRAAVNKARAA